MEHKQIVFGELLPQILAYSTISELIEYRLVNRQWKEVASNILLKRGSLKIQFEKTDVPPFKHKPTYYSFKSGYKIKWSHCYTHPKALAQLGELPSDRTLSSLIKLVKSPTPPVASSLPVSHFEFEICNCEKIQPLLSSFLEVYGHKIKVLTLRDFIIYSMSHQKLAHSILKNTPNLEKLYVKQTLRDKDIPPRTPLEQDNRIILPHLKYIEYEHEFEKTWSTFGRELKPAFDVLPYLLHISPQVQRIYFPNYFDPNFVEIIDPSKLNLLYIETLFLESHDLFFGGIQKLENLINVMVQSPHGASLKHLRLWVGEWPNTMESWKRGTRALCQILEVNKNSIIEIELMSGAGAFLKKVRGLPVLEKVRKITIVLDAIADEVFLQSGDPDDVLDLLLQQDESFHGNSLSGLFPNLETLDLKQWHHDDFEDNVNVHENWFPFWNDKLMQVKTLLAKSCDFKFSPGHAKCYTLALDLCPEIESFSTCWPVSHFPLLFLPLWNLTQLTSLHLRFDKDYHDNGHTFLDLDATLTGLSRETVSTIYRNWEESGRWEAPKRCKTDKDEGGENWLLPRINSSILNLKNLKKLHLEVHDDLLTEPKMLISGVSAKFGFDLMKNLQVLIVVAQHHEHAECPECTRETKNNAWFELHKPLLAFQNVTTGLKGDVPCCIIDDEEFYQ